MSSYYKIVLVPIKLGATSEMNTSKELNLKKEKCSRDFDLHTFIHSSNVSVSKVPFLEIGRMTKSSTIGADPKSDFSCRHNAPVVKPGMQEHSL